MKVPLDEAPELLATKVGQLPGAAILESDPNSGPAARWSIYTAWPRETFEALGTQWRIHRSGEVTQEGNHRVLEALANFLRVHGLGDPVDPPTQDLPPFAGGAIGTFGYDLAPLIEVLPRKAIRTSAWPDISLSIYDEAIIVDNLRKSATLYVFEHGANSTPSEARLDRWRTALQQPSAPTRRSTLTTPLQSNFSPEEYRRAVGTALEYIAAGDIFQVNLSQRFEAKGILDPLDLYLRLRQESPAPYAAFLKRDDSAIVSASPELYYSISGR